MFKTLIAYLRTEGLRTARAIVPRHLRIRARMLHLDWQVWRLRHRVEAATAEIHYWTALRKSMPHHLSAARERARLASNRITRILDLRDTLGTHPRDEARRAAQQFEAARVLRHWRAPAANEPTANPAHDMAWLAEQQAHLDRALAQAEARCDATAARLP